jgi:hypothetical protein
MRLAQKKLGTQISAFYHLIRPSRAATPAILRDRRIYYRSNYVLAFIIYAKYWFRSKKSKKKKIRVIPSFRPFTPKNKFGVKKNPSVTRRRRYRRCHRWQKYVPHLQHRP